MAIFQDYITKFYIGTIKFDRLTIIKNTKESKKIIHLQNWLQLKRSNAKLKMSFHTTCNAKLSCRHS